MKNILLCSILLFTYATKAQFSGKMGYAYSPANFPDNSTMTDVTDFYSEVTSTLPCGPLIMWNGLWYDGLSTVGQVPVAAQVNSNASPVPYNYEEINVFTFFHYPSLIWLTTASQPLPNDFSNTTVRDSFLVMLKTHAIQQQPKNVFIGNEVSFYLEMDSVNYTHFRSFYNMAYDTIKFYSPATNVGTVFNYEHLSGKGALTGWNTPHWNALSDLDTAKLDVIGVTLYPFFNYTTADQIPSNYLDVLVQRTGNKKIVITETGWPADSTFAPAPWACSETEQVDFANALFDSIIPGKNIKSMNWLFLNYLMSDANDGYKIFRSVALKDSLGNDRAVRSVWEAKCAAVGIESNELTQELKVYPNPATNTLYIETKEVLNKNATLTLLDVFGREIKSIHALEKDITELDLKGMAAGIYFVQLSNPEYKKTIKIVVE
ncbi:MAG: T9SS type A sorting domain-containing protein [Bacteroidota bacterium]|nr:T9SS type A sorting domain-containing protein [Bacteroidota bacterium]